MEPKLFSSLRKCHVRSQCGFLALWMLLPTTILRAANQSEPRAMSVEEKRQERLLDYRQMLARKNFGDKVSAFKSKPSSLERYLQQASVFDPKVSDATDWLLRMMGRDPARSSLAGKAELSRLWVSYVLKQSRDQGGLLSRDLEALPGYRRDAENALVTRAQNLQDFPPDGTLNWSLLSAMGKGPESLASSAWMGATAVVNTSLFGADDASPRALAANSGSSSSGGGSSGGGSGGVSAGPSSASLDGPTILDPNLVAPSAESASRSYFKKMALAKKEDGFVSEQTVARNENLDKMDFDIPLEEVVTNDGKVKFLIPAKPGESEDQIVSDPRAKNCLGGSCDASGALAKSATSTGTSNSGSFTWTLPPIDLGTGVTGGGGISGGGISSSSGELLGGRSGSSGGSGRGGSQSTIPMAKGGEHSSSSGSGSSPSPAAAPQVAALSDGNSQPLPTSTGSRQPASVPTPAPAPKAPAVAATKVAPVNKPVAVAPQPQAKGSLEHLISKNSEGLTDLGAQRLQSDFEQIIQASAPAEPTPSVARSSGAPASPAGSSAAAPVARGAGAPAVRKAEVPEEVSSWATNYRAKHGKNPTVKDFQDLVNKKDKGASPAVVTAARNFTAEKLEEDCAEKFKKKSKSEIKAELRKGFLKSMETASVVFTPKVSAGPRALGAIEKGQELEQNVGAISDHSPEYDHARSLYSADPNSSERNVTKGLRDISLLLRGVTAIKNPTCLADVEALKSGGIYEPDNFCTSFGTTVDKIPPLSTKELHPGAMRLAALFYMIETTANVQDANFGNTQRLLVNLVSEKNRDVESNVTGQRIIPPDVQNSITRNFDRGICNRGNQWAGVVKGLELGLRAAAVKCRVFEAMQIQKKEPQVGFQICMVNSSCGNEDARDEVEVAISPVGKKMDASTTIRTEFLTQSQEIDLSAIPAVYRDLLSDNTPNNKIECDAVKRHYLFFAAMNFNTFSTSKAAPNRSVGGSFIHQGRK